MGYKMLDWDSDFFGVKVAHISSTVESDNKLSQTLKELKGNDVKLVYWSSVNKLPDQVVSNLGGSLVDVKVTYKTDLQKKYTNPPSTIIPYNSSFGISDLEQLAIQSGQYSRYAVDSKIKKEKFESLYKTWIQRSLTKEIADEVFVVSCSNKALGMITVGHKNGIGDIGLLAVDTHYRGNKYGEKLVLSAHQWFSSQGFIASQVVTQEGNTAACKLYEKCGYTIAKKDYFYHFWL